MCDEKLTILKLIKENKDILFGKFSITLTHEIKTKRWMDIAEKAKAVGIFEKDWKYLRDTTWQNWRKRTIEKKDRRMKTGSGGGKKFIYDESDKIILEIIGKDSPTLDGLSVPESCGKDTPTNHAATVTELENGIEDQISSDENVGKDNVGSGCSGFVPANNNTSSTNRKKKRTVKFVDNDLLDLKKKKIKEQTLMFKEKKELAQREKYKLDLELYKLENEMGLPPSKFTEQLYTIYKDVTNEVLMEDSTGTLTDVDDIKILESSLNNNEPTNIE